MEASGQKYFSRPVRAQADYQRIGTVDSLQRRHGTTDSIGDTQHCIRPTKMVSANDKTTEGGREKDSSTFLEKVYSIFQEGN